MVDDLVTSKQSKGLTIVDQINSHNANVFIGKLGDILFKAVDKPLGMAINWGRLWSLWPVHIETACCSVEFGAASGPRYDVERFGIIEAFGSLRQCDLVVVQGTITRKMAPGFVWYMIKCLNQNMLLQWVRVLSLEDYILIHTMYCLE